MATPRSGRLQRATERPSEGRKMRESNKQHIGKVVKLLMDETMNIMRWIGCHCCKFDVRF